MTDNNSSASEENRLSGFRKSYITFEHEGRASTARVIEPKKNTDESVNYLQYKEVDLETDIKVWGMEYIISRGSKEVPYATKIMTLTPGQQVSTHWHASKQETFILIEGKMIVELTLPNADKKTIKLTKRYSSITIEPNTPHTFYTPDDQDIDTIFIESSTMDRLNDSFRFTKSGSRK